MSYFVFAFGAVVEQVALGRGQACHAGCVFLDASHERASYDL